MSIRDFFKRSSVVNNASVADTLDYTNLSNDYQLALADGVGRPEILGSIEAAVAFVESSFLCGKVEPDVVDIGDLGAMVRELVLFGESVAVFEPRHEMAGFNITPCSGHRVFGENATDETTWRYQCEISAPTATHSVRRSGRTVLHVRKSYSTQTGKHRGIAPIQRARATVASARQSERACYVDLKSAHIRAVVQTEPNMAGVPHQKRDELTATLAENFGKSSADGRTPVLPFGFTWTPSGATSGPRPGLTEIRAALEKNMASLIGVPPALLGIGSGENANTIREYYRQWAATGLASISRAFERELRRKLREPDLTITHGRLFAGDLANRARAYKALVDSGFDEDAATVLLGLE